MKRTKNKIAKRLVAMLLALITVSAVLVTFCSCGGNHEEDYNAAVRYMKQGNYNEAVTIFDRISDYKDSNELARYCEALLYCEIGDYESAYEELCKIPDYKDTKMLLAQIYYETRLFEGINEAKKHYKNPESLSVNEVTLTYDPQGRPVSYKDRPSFIIKMSGQNGFGGYSTSWVLFNQDKGADKYEYTGSCDTLDYEESDDIYESIVIGMILTQIEYKKIENMINLDRISSIISSGKYGNIKRISDLDFEQISDLIP